MTWLIWVFFVVVGGIMLWGAISPRGQWNTMSAWAYRNAEANEPSDASYMLTRVVNVLGLIVLVVVAINLGIAVADG